MDAKELRAFRSFSFDNPDANFFFIDIRNANITANALKHRMLPTRHSHSRRSSFVGLNEFYIRVAVKTHAENVRLIEAFKRVLKTV